MPLPPYIASKRAADGRDREDYQTMFAQREGAVAAPTAALHFTPDLISRLTEAGIATETMTLHVGAGTFLPVKAEDTDDQRMHAAWGSIGQAAEARLNSIRQAGARHTPDGTSSITIPQCGTSRERVNRTEMVS